MNFLENSVFAWPDLFAIIDEPLQPSLVYTPRGAARLWVPSSPIRADDPMAAALGAGRASVLKGLAVPRTTTELARQLGLGASTVSWHLSQVGRAGLVEPHRLGRSVFYRPSHEGERLLDVFGGRE